MKCKDCGFSYIGETSRPMCVRIEEHKKEAEEAAQKHFTRSRKESVSDQNFSSAVAQHVAQTNHIMDWDNVKSLEQEPGYQMRGIKEAIHIRKTPDNMNRPQGERHQLPHLWDTASF